MKLYLSVLFTTPLFLLACGKDKKEAANTQPRPAPQVMAYVVGTTTVSNAISVPGTLVAAEASDIHPEVSGRITSLSIREGAQVSKGAVLGRLYDADLQAQKRKLEVQLKQAEQTANRYSELQQIGGISRQDYDIATLDVSNLKADLAIINTEIQKTYIRAPFSGKLGLKMVSPGAYVTPQSVVTTIQKTEGLRVDFSVPEQYAPQLKTGMPVHFTVSGSNETYGAKIMATNSGIAEGTRTLEVRAIVAGNESGLTPGGFATVQIAFAPDNEAMMLPSQAIIPTARGKQVAIYRNGIVLFTEVTTGPRDSSRIQVLSGLQAGDTIVTTGLMSLKDSSRVQLRAIQQ